MPAPPTRDEVEKRIREHAGTYSPDVELEIGGRLVWARNVGEGEVVCIPMHMLTRPQRRG